MERKCNIYNSQYLQKNRVQGAINAGKNFRQRKTRDCWGRVVSTADPYQGSREFGTRSGDWLFWCFHALSTSLQANVVTVLQNRQRSLHFTSFPNLKV